MNKRAAAGPELVCLMTSLQYQFLSSSLLKEVANLGGDVNSMVPKHVAKALTEKFKQERLLSEKYLTYFKKRGGIYGVQNYRECISWELVKANARIKQSVRAQALIRSTRINAPSVSRPRFVKVC